MAEGFRVRNSANILQIDGIYQNLELLFKATLTLSLSNSIGCYNDIVVPANKVNALIALYDTGTGCYIQVSSSGVYRVYSELSQKGKTIEYFLFAEPNDSPQIGGVGFVVRNPNTAKVIFHSARRYFRVMQTFIGDIPIDTQISVSFPGRKIAILQCMRVRYWRFDTGGTGGTPSFVVTIRSGVMRVDGAGNAIVQNKIVAQLGGPGGGTAGTDNFPYGSYMFIDVTNF